MSLLSAQNLSYSAGGAALVENASFDLEPGTLTALVGPNGAGKTTLLRLALGLLETETGHTSLEGKDIAGLTPIERARKLAYLPQARPLVWPQPVRDIVALGRFAYGASPDRMTDADTKAVVRAITACGLEGFEARAADTLSGGELSRVHLARALAAETPVLIADEPVAALDPRYQHEVLGLLKNAAEEGCAVLTVIHDLSLAARYCDRLIWMKDGRIVGDGSPADTVTKERLLDTFDIDTKVMVSGDGVVTLNVLGPA